VLEDGKPQTITVFEEHKATEVQEFRERRRRCPPHVSRISAGYRIRARPIVAAAGCAETPLNDQSDAAGADAEVSAHTDSRRDADRGLLTMDVAAANDFRGSRRMWR